MARAGRKDVPIRRARGENTVAWIAALRLHCSRAYHGGADRLCLQSLYAAGLLLFCIASGPVGCGGETDGGAAVAEFVSQPPDAATAVPLGTWPELLFPSQAVLESVRDVVLECDGARARARIHRLPPRRLIVQPRVPLPAAAHCRLGWSQSGRSASIGFDTWNASGSSSGRLRVVYRKSDPDEIAPVPDDFWTRPDAASATGRRLELPITVRNDVREILAGLRSELERLDGWSPIAPIVLELSSAVDPASLPRSVADSLDPASTIALVEIDPESPRRGERFPFEVVVRRDEQVIGAESHALWIRPARPLRPGARYALLMRRGVHGLDGRAMSEPGMQRPILKGQPVPAVGVRATLAVLLAPALDVARTRLVIPWTEDDLVFALTFTVGSLAGLDRDPMALRAAVEALPGARLQVDRVEVARDARRPLAAIVRGHFAAPRWRHASQGSGEAGRESDEAGEESGALARDARGRPRVLGSRLIEFTLALPRSAVDTPAPLLIYQHGNPGLARDEVGAPLQDPWLEAGFAIVGMTDIWNRRDAGRDFDRATAVTTQVLDVMTSVRQEGVVPDDWIGTLGEQLAFVAALRERGRLDVLPFAAPDGRPDIDAALPLVYEGISQGAIHGQALIAYAPEIRAASLVAGGARWTELPMHQAADRMVRTLPLLFGDFSPVDLWVTLSLFQTAVDRQDAHLHAMSVRRESEALRSASHRGMHSGVGGAATSAASVLLTAGRGDGYVPNLASRSLAWVLGPLPWLGEREWGALALPWAQAPLRGNLADGATGAYVELVPFGRREPAAPGCRPEALPIPLELLREGHFCAQLAEESVRRRVTFLRSAVDDAPPVVIDPLRPNANANTDAKRVPTGTREQDRG